MDNISDIQDISRLFWSLLIYLRNHWSKDGTCSSLLMISLISLLFTVEKSRLNPASYHITYWRLAVFSVNCWLNTVVRKQKGFKLLNAVLHNHRWSWNSKLLTCLGKCLFHTNARESQLSSVAYMKPHPVGERSFY